MENGKRSEHAMQPRQRAGNHAERFAAKIEAEGYGPGSIARYSREEIVAELTSCFLGQELGFTAHTLELNASYLYHWIELCAAAHNLSYHEDGIMRRRPTERLVFLFV